MINDHGKMYSTASGFRTLDPLDSPSCALHIELTRPACSLFKYFYKSMVICMRWKTRCELLCLWNNNAAMLTNALWNLTRIGSTVTVPLSKCVEAHLTIDMLVCALLSVTFRGNVYMAYFIFMFYGSKLSKYVFYLLFILSYKWYYIE